MKKKSVALAAILCATVLSVAGIYANSVASYQTGERLLKDFYDFNLQTIVNNDADIKKITTDKIYQSHTISSDNRQLRVYLKFQGEPTSVKILSHEGDTIYYSVNNSNIDPERVFVLKYHYWLGKIDKVVEYEVVFLPQSSRSDLID